MNPTPLLVLSLVGCALAALPVGLSLVNLIAFRRAPRVAVWAVPSRATAISILIPARDEAHVIRECVQAALSSRLVEVEVIVLDDHSRDGTADIVKEIARHDPRLRVEPSPPLPSGWCGKQHACHVLARLARHDRLLFIDADVRLTPDAATRAAAFLDRSGAALVSGFPRQETGSLMEQLLIPLIHIVLLGYLPLHMMRWRRTAPSLGAGCGQFFLARRHEYEEVGGHSAVRALMHDGLQLPRAFRAAGFTADVFDALDIATCRMYRGSRACWDGLSKNATEGMASPRAIVPWTFLLVGGHVLPVVLFVALGLLTLAGWQVTTALVLAATATLLVYTMRVIAALRLNHPLLGVLMHPIAVLLLVCIQWIALSRHATGRPAAWKGRVYGPAVGR